MFCGRHLTRFMTCLLVLLVAGCGPPSVTNLGPASVTIVVDLPPPQQSYTVLWFGVTSSSPSGPGNNTQAWNTKSVSADHYHNAITFKQSNGLQPGSWLLQVIVTQGEPGSFYISTDEYKPCQKNLSAGTNTTVIFTVQPGTPDILVCSPPAIGGARPAWPPPKR